MQNLWKVEAHAHTAEVSLCARMPAAQMAEQVKAKGYDAVIVTDHYTPELFDAHRSGTAYTDHLMQRFFAGYRRASEQGAKLGLRVFPALEVRIADGPEDYLIYGVTPEELCALPCLAYLSLPDLYAAVHSTSDGLILQAHPFREYLSCQSAALLDGVEICNTNPRHNSHNDRALAFAQQHGLLMSAGSDVHELGDAGGAGVTCPPFADLREFARLLRAGKVDCFCDRP